MIQLIKAILFLLVNVAGYFTIPLLGGVAAKLDQFPSLPPGEHLELFVLWYFGIGGGWVFGFSALISVGYFVARDSIKHILLFAPMYNTFLFGLGVLIYFNHFHTV